MSNPVSRRDLFKTGGVIAVGLVAPPWLARVARADMLRSAAGGTAPDSVLVVCQLSGGNDGLNTLIPYADAKYRELRPQLGIAEDRVIKATDSLGFHPSMAGIAELYREGKVAFVQGVGYPNPDRSHFKSMEIWQTGSPDGSLKYGWLGRHFDNLMDQGPVSPVVGMGLSVEKPRSLVAGKAAIPCFASLADIQNMVGDPDAERRLREIQGSEKGPDDPLRVVQLANQSALDAMTELKSKLATKSPAQTYGEDSFGKGFRQIAHILMCSPATRVVYFSAGGFDTHSRQPDQHAKLLQGLSDALLAFQREMEAAGRADKVTVMCFSEFGRRAYENGSQGTDHGQAGPMVLVGKPVKGGMYGQTPSLTDLSRGDLKWSTDFRQVYATALDDWMASDSGAVLGKEFGSLGLFA
ncbi:MAG: DUF1501 domain-containing protein [Fimbriimonadaceae bacterium]|nr:DUF1501 domain-containing protein [Fimbriimonadaceae bacterium]